ncbi:MAG: redox-regulated ATPase YchF [Deltaproteobacteria bacterium HGW-Deltaproteobacteria-9]|nr:MAG: redox-regulated ATPase YchF [Deltaproteobacteria bacterium HGW-Deltaproteobacteria-9]
MEMGILGLPQSGKSTLFQIMTGTKSSASHTETCVRGQASVPDERFDQLVAIYQPVKVSPAKVPFVDVHAVGDHPWESVRQNLSGTDAILHVVDGFSLPDVQVCIDSYRKLEDELILSDLLIIEKKLERLTKMSKKALSPQDISQVEILPKLKDILEAGKPLRAAGLTEAEVFALRSFSFWSIKPELVVINVAEDNIALADAFAKTANLTEPVIGICCKIEAELTSLDAADQKEFLASLGISEPAFGRIIRGAFSLLGRISFFTTGKDEVKAWVIPKGSKAPKAAGSIHNDFERGFIKAEVMSYDDFIACGKTEAAVKSAGRMRLEGKEYIVHDGDIITFRFNI